MQYTLNQTNYCTFHIFEQNKLPGRSYFIPYPDREGADGVSPREKRYRSEKVVCLNGDWDFKFYPRPAELPEVLAMSDRIYIMNASRIVGEMPASEATQENIMAMILKSGRGD